MEKHVDERIIKNMLIRKTSHSKQAFLRTPNKMVFLGEYPISFTSVRIRELAYESAERIMFKLHSNSEYGRTVHEYAEEANKEIYSDTDSAAT